MFIGNEKAKLLLESFSKMEKIPHFLLVGPSGHGKTTLIRLAAKNKNLIEFNARTIKDKLPDITPDTILFLDEIHALVPELQETLFEHMEKTPHWTLTGATTKEDKLLEAFKNRFYIIHLKPYEYKELILMAQQYLKPGADYEVSLILADHARGIPRVLKRLCETFDNFGYRTGNQALELLHMLDVYPMGLTETEVRLMHTLKSGTYSLSSLSAVMKLEEQVIKKEHEPFLLEKGFVELSKSGRSLTQKGRDILPKLVI
jgi:Holliday junction DNA helicase RuvB